MRQCGSRTSSTGSGPPPREVRYPFGVQNDLGHVSIPASKELGGSGGRTTPLGSTPSPWRPQLPHRQSTPSLQSTSLQCSLASSCDLSTDGLLLERAVRANDPVRVKRILNIHHDKFQVNLHGSLLGKSSSDDSQSQDVEILLRKSKTLIDRLEPEKKSESNSSCSGSSSSLSSGGVGDVPLLFINALHLAVEYGAVDVLRLLLKYGLEPNQGGRVPGYRSKRASRVLSPKPPEPPSPAQPPPQQSSAQLTPQPSPSISGAVSIDESPSVPHGRRVSWVGAKTRRAAQSLKALARQRSLSLESDGELLRAERRSVSLKSSPLVSPRPPSAQPPEKERSIFIELRRSSEIFKSILLNFSMKEQDAEDEEEEPSRGEEPQVDVAELLAAHDRLRTQEEELSTSSASSSSTSISSSSEDEAEAVPEDAAIEAESRLKLNPNLPPDKTVGLAETYTRPYLFTLPVLFLAVVRGNATLVYLLLKYGAAVNFQDSHGNTALHLAVARETIPWESVVEMIERGAQVSLPNRRGVRASDLAPTGLLPFLQAALINNSWPEGVQQQRVTRASSKKPKAKEGFAEEGGSQASTEQRELSSTGSTRSSLNRSPDLTKEGPDCKKKESENRKRARRKWLEARERQTSTVSEKYYGQDSEKGFTVLLQMASNPEVLGHILRGLLAHIPRLLKLLQYGNDSSLHRNMAALLHKLLKTSLETFSDPRGFGGLDEEGRRRELSAACCLLLKTCLSLIHGVHDLQFTAMVTINKVIDTCIVHRLAHYKVKVSDALEHPSTRSEKNEKKPTSGTSGTNPEETKLNRRGKVNKGKRLGSVWRHAAGEHLEQVRRTLEADVIEHEESVMDVLSSVHAMSVLNILHNALTLYKRVIGSKQQCTPSQR